MTFVCVECQQPTSIYRCRHCRARYCSQRCYAQHNDRCHRFETADRCRCEETAEGAMNASTLHTNTPQSGEKAALSTPQRRDEFVLQGAHLSALAGDSRLRSMLRVRELRHALRLVNQSRCPLEALEAALFNIPEFRAFSDHVLHVLEECDSAFFA